MSDSTDRLAALLADETASHILVIDDDARLRQLLRRYLNDNGYVVSTAASPTEARSLMVLFAFDALVVDVMMPGESGLEFVGRLRETSAVPVLMLTAQGDPENRILGLEQGADDYMAKPFEPRELLLRLVSLLRRAQRAEPAPVATASQPAIISLGPASFDLSRMALERDGERVHLTSAEAALLAALATEPGVLLTREDLAAKAGIESESARTVDVQVTRLRRKIEDDPREPRYLHTIRGKGYMLRPG